MSISEIAKIVSFDPDIDAFDQLLDCVVDAYRQCRTLERENPPHLGEQERREWALAGIRETLEGRPLECFSAESLEFIGLLIDYWRVAEREVGGAPVVDPLQ